MKYIAKHEQSAMLCTHEEITCWQGGKTAQKKPENKLIKNQLLELEVQSLYAKLVSISSFQRRKILLRIEHAHCGKN